MNYSIGCDISHYQDDPTTLTRHVNFDQMKLNGADFCFMKASQTLWTDKTFKPHWIGAKDAGLLRGAYHFLTFDVDGRKQAEYYWSLIEHDPGELPPVCDYERFGNIPGSASDYLWAFCSTIERLSGVTPIIYTGAFFWNETVPRSATWRKFPLWMASYTSQSYMEANVARLTPWDAWTFWQFTDKGNGNNYGAESKQIDLNYYNGTTEQLLAKYAGVHVPPTQPEYTDDEKLTLLWDAHPELHR